MKVYYLDFVPDSNGKPEDTDKRYTEQQLIQKQGTRVIHVATAYILKNNPDTGKEPTTKEKSKTIEEHFEA